MKRQTKTPGIETPGIEAWVDLEESTGLERPAIRACLDRAKGRRVSGELDWLRPGSQGQ